MKSIVSFFMNLFLFYWMLIIFTLVHVPNLIYHDNITGIYISETNKNPNTNIPFLKNIKNVEINNYFEISKL